MYVAAYDGNSDGLVRLVVARVYVQGRKDGAVTLCLLIITRQKRSPKVVEITQNVSLN
jgi:hypothetical protein